MTAQEPRTINLETPHYIVRTLEAAEATDNWRNWLTDPQAASMLNARPERLSADAARDHIAKFDRVNAHLLGIFEKAGGTLIGIRAVYIDHKHSEFLVNVLIGESEARNKGARAETRSVMYRYFFEEMGLATARCTALAANTPIMKVMAHNGWVHEHTDHKASATGHGTVEIRHFRLPRDVWRKKTAEGVG